MILLYSRKEVSNMRNKNKRKHSEFWSDVLLFLEPIAYVLKGIRWLIARIFD